ncbi:MAG: hypothetical protein GY898_27250 [Proteobacteria bacterium]|nr:hypothetical protein [Pseudomonadota bacterium]
MYRIALAGTMTVLLSLAFAPHAHAENIDSIGPTGSSISYTGWCFGVRVEPDRQTTVLQYDFWMKNTLGKALTFYVYENDVDTTSGWDRIESATMTKTGTVSNSAHAWETSPPLYAEFDPDKFYSVIACWPGSSVNISYTSNVTDELSFGTAIATSYTSIPEELDGDNDSLSKWNALLHARLHTSAGEPLDTEPPDPGLYASTSYTGPYFRGQVYTVSEDTVLLGFDQRYRVNASSTVNWAVYSCPGTGPTCGSWTLQDTGTTTTVHDSNNLDQFLVAEDVQVQMTAGNKYWVGYLGNSSTGYWRWTHSSNPAADPSWGETLGFYYSNDNSVEPTMTLNASTSNAMAQHLHTLDSDGDELDATGTCCGSANYHQGSVFSIDSATRIEQFAVEIDPTSDDTIVFGVYTGLSQTGPFTLKASHEVDIQGTDGLHWIESGTFDIDVVPSEGFVNLAVGYFATGHPRGWNINLPPDPNVTFGQYKRLTYGTVVGGGLPVTLSPSSTTNTWSTRVESCATCADYDGDGVTALTDCDDEDADAYPGNTEVCDLIDNDCDGSTDEGFDNDGDGQASCDGDCDDGDPDNYSGNTEVCDAQDNDCGGDVDEGFDADTDGVTTCGPDGVTGNLDDDCDDTDPDNYPTNDESCEGFDNDCDGDVDEDFDLDSDNYPDENEAECASNLPSSSLDCDDGSFSVNPGATEICNTVDDDCDGTVDDGFDIDNDGFFDEDDCTFGDDCNDNNFNINPDATEACNGIDDDCDSVVPPNEADGDGDSWRICANDCQDTIPQVNPGAAEACDGYDSNCSGGLGNGSFGQADERDIDSDDYFACGPYAAWGNLSFGGDDCDDNEPLANPGEAEVCDGFDNDCDGTVDEDIDGDSDGQTTCEGDCDDADPNVNTSANEICDGKDSDCDGNLPGNEQDSDGDGYIDCTLHVDANPPESVEGGGDCNDTVAVIYPTAEEVCDGWDNDCNGVGETDGDGDEFLTCEPFVDNGAPDLSGGNDCNDSETLSFPGNTEVCDAIDNDCDGTVDDGFDNDEDTWFAGAGCASAYSDVDCNDSNSDVYPGATETCNSVDDDCDAATDEDFDDDLDGYFDDGPCPSGDDCDDQDANINPSILEICDAIDNNCDAFVDEGFDDDEDGFFDDGPCSFGDDCDDQDSDQNPDATEICNAEDDDCDTQIDEGFDADSDGYFDDVACAFGDDCDDTDATQNPGAPEVCNGADDDCDGVIPNGQPDGEVDDDNDGYYECEADCDDSDDTVYEDADEICDLIDNNCDGTVDEGFDADGDSYFSAIACSTGTDCDDSDAAINPAAAEVCDSIDNDCNGTVDDGFDLDFDGYFDGDVGDCAAAYGDQADCDDDDDTIHPNAEEVCDTVDQDCDLAIDEDFDTDEDGFFDVEDAGCASSYADTDCNDTNDTVYDGAPELCDVLDNDCDGSSDEDFDTDSDGFVDGSVDDCVAAYESTDCDDTLNTVNPDAPEVCDELDNDCDGLVPDDETDGDGDGFNECADNDCDDTDPAQYVGATEFCNAEDDDCDGTIDNGFDLDGDGYFDGDDAFCAATYEEAADCDDGVDTINPGADESCNLLDDDCDGEIDEDYDLDSDGAFDADECAGVYTDVFLDCNDTNDQVNPLQIENCTNGIDDDCDGTIDVDEDNDGDGVTTCGGDCDDDDSSIFPGGTEVCNALDDDCDGEIDEDFDADADDYVDGLDPGCQASYVDLDCNDGDALTFPGADEVCDTFDQDCDGVSDEDFDLDADGFFFGDGCDAAYPDTDCDDVAPGTFPGAPEFCNVLDDDCDGAVDEDFDVDLDGFFDGADGGCAANYGTDADCDDALDDVYPLAPELCDGRDNDCNGAIPPDEIDDDLDGYVECAAPEADHVGTPTGGGDCDDGEASVLPGAAELCNLVDDDCDGAIDEDFDLDGDGFVDGNEASCEAVYEFDLDCDDANADVFPEQVETCNAVDDDCDGLTDDGFDLDDDGYVDGDNPDCVAAYTDTDCDDEEPTVFPFNFEDCTNGVDDNCNGEVDEDTDDDGDGFTTCDGDCNDDDATVFVGALEVCDGVDQDCDFLIDEDFDFDGDGFTDVTVCPDGTDCDDGDSAIYPGADEACNAVDDDCDGDTDETFDLDSDGTFDRFQGDCVDTYGAANTDCDDTDPTISPDTDEVCNDLDDDCDGLSDDGFDLDGDGVWVDDADCVTTYGGPLDCDDGDDTVFPEFDGNPAAEEICDGLDTDCDGVIDEDADGDGFPDGDRADCVENLEPDELDCDDTDIDTNPDADEECEDTIDNDCDGDIDMDDADCIEGDDDDSSSDDDDDATDDDDAVEPPEIVDNDEYDPPSVFAGCSSCRSDVAGSGSVPLAGFLGLAFLGALGLARRRRNAPRVPRAAVLGLLVATAAMTMTAAPAAAQGALETEAQRQLDFAWKELEKGDFDAAIASADSALRLNPALYTAMVVKALAYEGKGELRRAESWLQTYLDLTANLSRSPEAVSLADRLKGQLDGGTSGQVKATSTVTVSEDYGAFGDGYVLLGGLVGGRGYSHTPCAGSEDCEPGDEGRPGFWSFDSGGFGGGGSLRAEYFFGGWYVGGRLRYDIGAGEPVNHWDVTAGPRPTHRLDANVVGKLPLTQGLTKLYLLGDIGYGLRSWTVYENVTSSLATSFSFGGSHLGGGIGVRVEPGRIVGIEGRFGVAGLLGGAGGLNDYSLEVGAVIRPVKPLMIRAAFDLRASHWLVNRDADAVEVRDITAGLWVGAGLVF